MPDRIRVLHLLLVACFPVALARGQSAPSMQPPTDSVVRAVVAVVNAGDAASRGRLIHDAFTTRARAADSAKIDRFLAMLHAQGAPYTLQKVDMLSRSAIARLASPRTGRVVTVQVATDRRDPVALGSVDVFTTRAAVYDSLVWPATRPRSDAALARIIERNFARLASAGAFAGVVSVQARGAIVFARAYGLADREHETPNTLTTRFSIASMGKMFTAVSILRLVEQGKLRLDDTLATVLPAYPNAERATRVTIRQLLEHTAGMGDQWSTPRRVVPGLTGSLAIAAEVAYPPLLFDPGSRWSYSNEGYSVLAAVIEQVAGTSFRDFIRREILAPAGMNETVLEGSSDDIVPQRAVGYRPRSDDLLGAMPPRANWSFMNGSISGGAGGGYSTVGDLARFGRALLNGPLLGAALRDSMWTGRWPIPGYAGEKYGLGAFVSDVGGKRVAGHGGGGVGSGMDNGFRMFTDGSYTVVVLTNMDPPAATELTAAIVRLLGAPVGDSRTSIR